MLRSEQKRTKVGKGLQHQVQPSGHQMPALVWNCKAWVYQLERSPHGHIMLEMVYLDMMLNEQINMAQWFGRNIDFWESVCKVWDLGEGNFQRGTKGARMVSPQKIGRAPTGVELAEIVPETCCSIIGAELALLHSAAPIDTKEKTSKQMDTAYTVPRNRNAYGFGKVRPCMCSHFTNMYSP